MAPQDPAGTQPIGRRARGSRAASPWSPPECIRRRRNATLEGMRIRRTPLAVIAVLLAAPAALWIARDRILAAAGAFLVDSDAAQRAGVILLLNGDLDTRPAAAAGLWKQRLAPRIAIARSESSRAVEMGLVPNVTDLALEILEREGVPREAIDEIPFPGGVTSTRDEARAVRAWLTRNPVPSILIVTNAIHTRRARWIFDRELGGAGVRVLLFAVPDRRYSVERWWDNEHGFLGVYNEYLKLVYYRLRY